MMKTLILAGSIAVLAGCQTTPNPPPAPYPKLPASEQAAKGSVTGRSQREFTPDEDLIYAVKGIKTGVALMMGLMNPLLGALVAAYNPDESNRDIRNINEALARGANIDARERHSGYTPLIYAAYGGYPNIALHLISKGANIQLKEDGGYNAYTMAKYYLKRYTKSARLNEEKPYDANFDYVEKQRMREYYNGYIERYSQIVKMLESETIDKEMPRAWLTWD